MTRRSLLLGGIAVVAVLGGYALLSERGSNHPESTGSSDETGQPDGPSSPSATRSPGADQLPRRFGHSGTGGPGRVEGEVVDAVSGDPVPYVDVIFRRSGFETTANSGEDGRYAIELGGGAYRVHAIGDGVLGLPQPQLLVRGHDEPVEFDVEVQRLGAIRGRVVDHTGGGVAGATVTYVPSTATEKLHIENGLIAGTVTAGTDGSFDIQVVSGGDIELEARSGGLRGRTRVTSLVPGARRTGVEIRLDQGAHLSGVVKSPRGTPVAGATVHASVRADGMDETMEIETGTDGEFELGPILAGTAVLEANADGHAQSAPKNVRLAPGDRTRITLVLQEPRALAGRVVDTDDEPVADVRVRTGRAGTRMDPLETHTGADGSFAFEELDRGPYWVSAYKQGYAVATEEQVATPRGDLTLQLRGHGGLRGVVTNPGGKPVREFVVRIVSYSPLGVAGAREGGPGTRFSDDEGRFELEPLEPGRYDIAVSGSGFAATSLDDVKVPPGDWADVEVTVRPGGRIEGRVTSARSGEPIPLARVRVAFVLSDAATFTGRDGRFSFDDVSPGWRSLVVTHPSFARLTVGGIALAAGETETVDIELAPETRSSGDGQVSGIGVVLDDRDGRVVVRDVLDDGPAASAGVKSGDVVAGIDGTSASGLDREAVADRLRGAAGSRVVLEITRGDRSRRFELVRARVKEPSDSEGLIARTDVSPAPASG